MSTKFHVDEDGEVSAQRPRKVPPMEDIAPKSAMKSAMKGGASNTSPSPSDGKAPKSAMKSAMKSSAPIPEPDEEPAASPPKPALKSGLKSGLKSKTVEDIKAPEGKPAAKKSALKSRSMAPEDAPSEPPRTSSKQAALSPAKNSRTSMGRPSSFKMTTAISELTADGLNAWSTRGLCRHYFHYVAQKNLWDEALLDGEGAGRKSTRKSIRVADLVLKALNGMGPTTSEKPACALADAVSPLKDLFLAKKPDADAVRVLLKGMPLAESAKWVNAPLDATPPPMPAPLPSAVAGVQTKLVEVLIEFGVDVNAHYPGKSMLKGWVKPNTPLSESCTNRKGRFVGTMLGDKLEEIEGMLLKAIKMKETGSTEPASPKVVQPAGRRKSVQMKCSQGVMEHSHDHPSSRYELMTHHDDGNPSNVREAVNIQSGEVYAIKAGNKADESCAQDPEAQLWNEIGIIRKMDHPNIVRLHETFENDSHIFMVLEGCLGGELFDRLVSEGSIGLAASLRLCYQIGSAIRHLHQVQICHRDVEPEAFFLAESGPLMSNGVKLMDFCSAKEFSSETKMFTKVCTLHYVAPEVVSSNGGYTEKVDIWSFGALMFTMIAGFPPFHSSDEMFTLRLIKEAKYEFLPADKWDDAGNDVKNLISRCLTIEPHKRPDMWGIMESPCMLEAEASGAAYVASDTLGRAKQDPSACGPTESQRCASTLAKTAFSFMAEVMSDEEVTMLRALFRELDISHHGMVELELMAPRVQAMIKGNPDADDLNKLLDTVPENCITGRVNYLMYMATLTDRRRQLKREAARAVFNNFDIDKNGHISLYEIAQAVSKFEVINLKKATTVSHKEVQKIWMEMGLVFGDKCQIQLEDQYKHLTESEMNFDEFFHMLPSSSKWDIGI